MRKLFDYLFDGVSSILCMFLLLAVCLGIPILLLKACGQTGTSYREYNPSPVVNNDGGADWEEVDCRDGTPWAC